MIASTAEMNRRLLMLLTLVSSAAASVPLAVAHALLDHAIPGDTQVAKGEFTFDIAP